MKKIIPIAILALFMFNNCGGVKPKTEPGKPTLQKEPLERLKTEESPPPPDPQEPPQSITQQPAGQQSTDDSKGKSAPLPHSSTEKEKPVATGPPTVAPTANAVVAPSQPEEKKTPPPEQARQEAEIDSITRGIAGIFRGFGYSGDIEVPKSFKDKVAYYIRYFSYNEKGSRFYRRAMNRGRRYMPMIRKALKAKHLPLSLAYLPLVESGYNPNARSHAGAVGMWQFMRGTARMYGLKVNRYKDERHIPEKATRAATEYLNDLLAMFGAEDPFLGICAYNAGEGKILRSLRKISYKERSFWTLVKKNLLRTETDEYIPRLLAVVLMANNPQKYAAASRLQEVEADEAEDMEIISSFHPSRADLVTYNQNPESLETPETVTTTIRPKTDAPTTTPTTAAATERKLTKGNTYKVRKGDTLYSIARSFGVTVRKVKKWNGLRSNRIKLGQHLKILASGNSRTGKSSKSKAKNKSRSSGYKLIYTVNYTDSLARIALFFKGINVRDIMRWNRLRRTRIYPKQKLTLYLKQKPRKILNHTIKQGENAGSIARRYKSRVEYVLSLNGLLTNSKLKPGRKLKIYYF